METLSRGDGTYLRCFLHSLHDGHSIVQTIPRRAWAPFEAFCLHEDRRVAAIKNLERKRQQLLAHFLEAVHNQPEPFKAAWIKFLADRVLKLAKEIFEQQEAHNMATYSLAEQNQLSVKMLGAGLCWPVPPR